MSIHLRRYPNVSHIIRHYNSVVPHFQSSLLLHKQPLEEPSKAFEYFIFTSSPYTGPVIREVYFQSPFMQTVIRLLPHFYFCPFVKNIRSIKWR